MSEYTYTTDNENRRERGVNKGRGKSILAHRLIWRQNHGEIPNNFFIHHIDGNKKNNNIKNLKLMSRSDHVKGHWSNVGENQFFQIDKLKRKKQCEKCGNMFELGLDKYGRLKGSRKFCYICSPPKSILRVKNKGSECILAKKLTLS